MVLELEAAVAEESGGGAAALGAHRSQGGQRVVVGVVPAGEEVPVSEEVSAGAALVGHGVPVGGAGRRLNPEIASACCCKRALAPVIMGDMTETTLRSFPSDTARELGDRARRLADDLGDALDDVRHRVADDPRLDRLTNAVESLRDDLGSLRDDIQLDRLSDAVESLRDDLRDADAADRLNAFVDDLREAGDDARERLVGALRDLGERVRADGGSLVRQLDGYAPVRRAELDALAHRVEAAERSAKAAAKKADKADRRLKELAAATKRSAPKAKAKTTPAASEG